ncbi:hypothetical protein C8Q76DRAFT_801292 [Earliella scabrosa]|nr:hypothetical protein C8Q76DRAFT_801292 [Earliella scabrosa]
MRATAFDMLASLAALALGATVVSARGISSSLTRRQVFTDTCANLDTAVDTPDGEVVDITGCVCLSSVSDFIAGNPGAQALVGIVGLDETTQVLNELIIGDQTSQQCTYPENSVPACTADDVCAFTCTNGFTASPAGAPTQCVCESPNTVCNGVCSNAACPTGAAGSNGRRGYYGGSVLRKRAQCAKGHTVCGKYERRGALSDPWECVNTASDLESCGGCITPLDAHSPRGVDCSALPGVVDVACTTGLCVVHRCADGFTASRDNSSCIATPAYMAVQPF